MPTLPDRIENFIIWLDIQLQEHGLTDSELARKGGLSHSVISRLRSGTLPGWDSVCAIAHGLNLPPEMALRASGHLPQLPDQDPLHIELDYLFSKASPAQRAEILHYIRYLIEHT